MQVTVLGAGSWGTTVASLAAGRNPTTLWARNADVATEVNEKHTNEGYLQGFALPEQLAANSYMFSLLSQVPLPVQALPSLTQAIIVNALVPAISSDADCGTVTQLLPLKR